MSDTFYPPGFKPPVLQKLGSDAPPVDNEGKRLFEGEKFHVIPNDREEGRIGEAHGLDIFEKVKELITDRAGGTVVPLDKASYILIRHSDINRFAETFDPVSARRMIHFDWVMDSLIVRHRISRDRYWGIPREREKAEKHRAQGLALICQDIPRDPRKDQSMRNPGRCQDQYDLEVSNRVASCSSSNSQYHATKGEFSWYEARGASESYRGVPGYSETSIPSMRRSSYDILRQVSSCFAGVGFYVRGPIPAKRNIERKIRECDGTLCDIIQQASRVIVVDPRFLFGFKDGNSGTTVYGKKQLFGDFELSARAGKIILTEGFIHDCHHRKRMLDEKEYMVEKEDLEGFQCWARTKDRNLLRSRQNPNFMVCGGREVAKSVDSERQRYVSRFYATPESPERLNQPVESPDNTLSPEDAFLTSHSRNLNNVQTDADEEKSSVAANRSPSHPNPPMPKYDDEDLDICCTDPEDESEEGGKGIFQSRSRLVTSKQDSRSSSPLTVDEDVDSNEPDDEKQNDPSYVEKKVGSRKRRVKENNSGDSLKRDRKWYRTQHDTVHPSDQEQYDQLIDILRSQLKTNKSIPKGGMRAFTAGYGLESIYRRYSAIIREAVPGLPVGGPQKKLRKTR
ncbi:hypothetical protein L486_01107 [Kwoniella mangroviensis CBS 10435]|uniref:BRCT domain-containing protein n=1 Tax=Kwoniella mangroviensis CBS 10435 TaxID=1331196 RepID=A0A1B9J107_9TREE|nr:hypothetical protein L486_01107 [Kwoniella mangroviensis CBS 10435]